VKHRKWLQTIEAYSELARLKRCLGCNLRNLSHLNNLCDPLHKELRTYVAMLQCESLLTSAPADCVDRGEVVVVFGI